MIGTVWAAGTWVDDSWAAGSWADLGDQPTPAGRPVALTGSDRSRVTLTGADRSRVALTADLTR